MHPSIVTTGWFRQRNLAGRRPLSKEPSNEAVVYALVTLAVRPSELPEKAAEYVARNYLAHCVSEGPPN